MYPFAQTIRKYVKKKGWRIPQFAAEIQRSPEHARKLYNGKTTPSSELVETIVSKLEIPADEDFSSKVDRARFEQRYHRKPPSGESQDLMPLRRIWSQLSGDEQDYLVCFANCLADRQRERRKKTGSEH